MINSSNDTVYGKTFSSYSQKEFEDFSAFFERRLINNGINPEDLFKGKTCLDAGCGGGRGSFLMLKYGARKVIGVDQSELNTTSFKERIKNTDKESRFSSVNCDLENLELSEKFDFVWFSGVIQHTIKPSLVFENVFKHLKKGGYTFFYAYGKDGIYWQLVDLARNILKNISDERILEILSSLSLENRYIAEYMDDWKVPFLRAYTDDEMRESLQKCGINPIIRLFWGENYDTCLRLKMYEEEKELWGEGDLRYFGIKTKESFGKISNHLDKNENFLSENFSSYNEVIKLCESILSKKSNLIDKIYLLAKIQRILRDRMNLKEEFSITKIKEEIKNI